MTGVEKVRRWAKEAAYRRANRNETDKAIDYEMWSVRQSYVFSLCECYSAYLRGLIESEELMNRESGNYLWSNPSPEEPGSFINQLTTAAITAWKEIVNETQET